MRDIKFRVWDKRNKELLGPWTLQEMLSEGYKIDGWYELMQYTGLKDENGKEIYEGDIVKYQGCRSFDYDDKDEIIEEVKFVDGAFEPIYFSQRELHTYDDELIIVEDVEVIGNIYENPELLK